MLLACAGEPHDIGDEADTGAQGGSGGSGTTTGLTVGSTNSSGGTSSVSNSGSGTGTTGTSPIDPLSGVACEGLPPNAEVSGAAGAGEKPCTGVGSEVEAVPVDMYIMVDKTSSMTNTQVEGGLTRWELVTEALKEFVTSEGLEDVGVGLQFFSWTGEADCDPARYATPAVGIGPAPDVANAVIAAIDAEEPIGQTPTYPALQGAIQYAKAWAQENLGRKTVVVFVTDGYPTQCNGQQIPEVAQLAQDAYAESPQVPIFVVGIDGIYNLDQIAQRGGTSKAFNVESGGTAADLVRTLSNITDSEAHCEFDLPPPPPMMSLDLTKVQMVHTEASGDVFEIPFSPNGYTGCEHSENGGWYYAGHDADGIPTKIVVCPCTCSSFQAGKVSVSVGCSPAYVVD